MKEASVDQHLLLGHHHYSRRPQYMRMKGCMPNVGIVRMMLFPFLFTLYSYNSNLPKLFYDSAIIGCISDGGRGGVVLKCINVVCRNTCCST